MRAFHSKLPDVGTTIFTVMSQYAAEHQAINLSQGFPDFDGDGLLKERVNHYINTGLNQYAPMTGLPALREQIALKTEQCYQRTVCADVEVTVTSGATEALFAAIMCAVKPGDQVVVFDPAYDSYDPAIRMAGGEPIHVALTADFAIDFAALEAVMSERVRMIIINSPHNPSGRVLDESAMQQLQQLVVQFNCWCLSDEVYEHIIFDQQPHQSVHRFPDLAERSFVVSSFGKTFHTTGWKVGYCIAPQAMMSEFRKVHQYVTFSTSTPMQAAIADTLAAKPELWQDLPQFYQQKRDELRAALAPSRLQLLPCEGTYFQLVDYSAVSDLPEVEFAKWLTREVGVAVIPISVFYQQPHEARLARLCFAKNSATLIEAAEKLCQL